MNPQKLGRYIIKESLGQGGMATVYRAEDPRFRREVAVKILPRDLVNKPTFRARFDREARIIASLEHPAIVPVYDFGEDQGVPFLVMRLMTGGSLANRLSDGPLPLSQVTGIIKRVASALDEAHAQGIVHRDLKPGNILFDSRDEPFLADFGIVKIAQENTASLTRTGGIIGTPAYMSPEQVAGQQELDGRSDIYALGIIFFEMLTGDLPFKADTPMGIAIQHINQPVPQIRLIRADLPATIEKISTRVLAKKPEDRFQTAMEFAKSIEHLHKEKTTTPSVAQPTLYESDTERELYEEALQAQADQNWDKAIRLLTSLLGLNPDFRDAPQQFSMALRRKQIAEKLLSADKALSNKEWSKVVSVASQILQTDPENLVAQKMLQQAKREQRLAASYKDAQAALDEEKWEQALRELESILETAPDYLDAQLLKLAEEERRKQLHLSRLFEEGNQAFNAGLLDVADDFFRELQELDPGYAGLEACFGKLAAAREKIDRAEEFFNTARKYAQNEDWNQANLALKEAMLLLPNEQKFSAFHKSLQEEECVFNNYHAANQAMASEKWETAVKLFAEILEQKPDYKDVETLLAQSQERSAEQIRAQELYDQGLAAINNMDWHGAISHFKNLEVSYPNFKDTSMHLAQAEEKWAALKEQEEREKQGLRLIAEAEEAEQSGDWGTAVAHLNEAAALLPANVDISNRLEIAMAAASKEKEQQRIKAALQDAIAKQDWQSANAYTEELQFLSSSDSIREPIQFPTEIIEPPATELIISSSHTANGKPGFRRIYYFLFILIGGGIIGLFVVFRNLGGNELNIQSATPMESNVAETTADITTESINATIIEDSNQETTQTPVSTSPGKSVSNVTPTISPSHTNVATNPPTTETATVTPTSTPTESASRLTPTPIIENSVIEYADDFEGYSFAFQQYGDLDYSGNNLKISEGGGITYRTHITEGTSAIFLINFTPGEFNCYLANEESYWDMYVGIKTNNGFDLITSVATTNNVWIGGERFIGNLSFQPNQWYFVQLKWLTDDIFFLTVWEKDNPEVFTKRNLQLGSEWEGQKWYPHCNVTSGELTIDSFQELK